MVLAVLLMLVVRFYGPFISIGAATPGAYLDSSVLIPATPFTSAGTTKQTNSFSPCSFSPILPSHIPIMDREEEATQRISATMGLGDTPHKAAFTRAITNALNTKIAEMTFAQIADGMPQAETVQQSKSPHPPKGHPVYAHTELCAGAIEKVRELRQALDMGDLCSQAEVSETAPPAHLLQLMLHSCSRSIVPRRLGQDSSAYAS